DSMSYPPLLAAKKANIPIRIAHSHNTAIDRDFKYFLKSYFKLKLPEVANYYCACGKAAGEFLFPGKKYTYIPNAIEIDRFLYDEKVRIKKRAELGIKDEVVIGHIGRMSYQKNHKFLIDIFAEILKSKNDCVLLLIGMGEKLDDIK
ncbi:glycosyltransferase, partial [Lactococcus lactis]